MSRRYEIADDIPMDSRRAKVSVLMPVLESLKVGESFFVPIADFDPTSVMGLLGGLARSRRTTKLFKAQQVRQNGKLGSRVWRTA